MPSLIIVRTFELPGIIALSQIIGIADETSFCRNVRAQASAMIRRTDTVIKRRIGLPINHRPEFQITDARSSFQWQRFTDQPVHSDKSTPILMPYG